MQDRESAHPLSHYTNYDLISCVEDLPAQHQRLNVTVPVAFFTSCVVVSLLGGFGLRLVTTFRKLRKGLRIEAHQHAVTGSGGKEGMEDPVRLATRALGWGTLVAVIGSGAVGISTFYTWKL